MKKVLHLWIDSFSRGGLEKSFSFFVKEFSLSYPEAEIIIHTLSSSSQYIKELPFSPLMRIRHYPSRLSAFISFFTKLGSNDVLISFKNHIPLVLWLRLFNKQNSLWIRHSNTLLAQLRRTSLSSCSFVSRFLSYIDFTLRCYIYSFCPNHLTNSLENSMLIETFTRQITYTYYTCQFNEEEIPRIDSSVSSTINILWSGRYCQSKGIDVLLNFSSKLIHQSLSNSSSSLSTFFDFYTNDTNAFFEKLQKRIAGVDSSKYVAVHKWTPLLDIRSYEIVVITSVYEGLSNFYLECLCSDVIILAPNSSSGFIEFAYSRPNVFLYDLMDVNSLWDTYLEAIAVVGTSSSYSKEHKDFIYQRIKQTNQSFINKIGRLVV